MDRLIIVLNVTKYSSGKRRPVLFWGFFHERKWKLLKVKKSLTALFSTDKYPFK
jgi:hypothetical protein